VSRVLPIEGVSDDRSVHLATWLAEMSLSTTTVQPAQVCEQRRVDTEARARSAPGQGMPRVRWRAQT
jgi:hypothetical protein